MCEDQLGLDNLKLVPTSPPSENDQDDPYDPYEEKTEEMANAHLGRVIDSRPAGEDAAGHQDHSLKMGLPAKFQKHYCYRCCSHHWHCCLQLQHSAKVQFTV